MNILHVKYAVEIARAGSLNKASEKLFVAVPNLSRSVKELEQDLGITIFERSSKGVNLTADGEEFIGYAKGLIRQIEHIEGVFKSREPKKESFSISVPRAQYIAEAFVEFSKKLPNNPAEIFYKETNSQRTISNMINHDYKLGIIRYAENYEKFFASMLEEKQLRFEKIASFSYELIMSKDNPLSKKEDITFSDLRNCIEIAHADPYVPSLPLSRVVKEELPDDIDRRIFIFERASQLDLLSSNPQTFMWVSPTPKKVLSKYNLVSKKCRENKKVYNDVLIYKKGYSMSELDKAFIEELSYAIKEYL